MSKTYSDTAPTTDTKSKSSKQAESLTVRVCKKRLIPLTPIPKAKHHRFYWYLSMIICGRLEERGTVIDTSHREKIIEHLLKVRNEYLDNNSWDSTVKVQFESAYKATKDGNNNFYPKVALQEGDYYEFAL